MKAVVGDRIHALGRKVGDPVRSGLVTALRGAADDPLWVVRWDDGHEGVFAPGADTRVEHPAGT